ncbi:hypothetical protein JFU48_25815 [Pseudomonas sp. TH49]|uniref:DUF7693 domain-containing protein n=1 Tax=Pseudomonas fluorescens R124 TaxID=743713 RepID=A0A7U9CPK9_PSEFL|nr:MULTISPECIES: hypothetical protein [Pseudomonas]EJZ57736.1 hypothetical protein I1A_002061 [Pseudomonas fluorescens R124]MBK5344759.1 hypothetical protein [Pseudomonas sp. TH49]MCU1772638.1 hypothetical protein [Pseudomonas sp. 13B_3.2_Bac1]
MTALLTARDVCQRLREAALGVLMFNRLEASGAAGLVAVDIEGWRLLLDVEGGRLHHCEHCRCPDGREWHFNSRYGTDPVNLLSTWELAQIENLLKP